MFSCFDHPPVASLRTGDSFTLSVPGSALGRDVQKMVCDRLPVKAGAGVALVYQEPLGHGWLHGVDRLVDSG